MDKVFDVAIIGGGINGCGCAADAALRGLSVVLFEQDDLASKTSSSSTKLIHGGLRYLEYYEFKLVKKALEERQTLLSIAPHLVHPQPFILPHQKHMRPPWFLRLGLFIYDNLSRKNRLPHCKSINRKANKSDFSPLKDTLNKGFLFYDAATDDARLTIVNALQAKNNGASIRPRSKVIKTQALNNGWEITIEPETGAVYTIHAKVLINATGPWVLDTAMMSHIPLNHDMALVKGSHILVPKMYDGDHAYFLQHEDKRIVFTIPYHGLTMIGTTDVPLTGSLDSLEISQEEVDYLIDLSNHYFKATLKSCDIVSSWSGVRPLLGSANKKASSLSRDYAYEVCSSPAPLVSILGGKITTYRQLSEEVINQLSAFFPKLSESVTEYTPLPGASLHNMSFNEYSEYAKKTYPWLEEKLLQRYLHSYGTHTEQFLAQCSDIESMGTKYGEELYQVEVDYLIKEEWAQNVDDILERRTKLGLSMNAACKRNLADYLRLKRSSLNTTSSAQ